MRADTKEPCSLPSCLAQQVLRALMWTFATFPQGYAKCYANAPLGWGWGFATPLGSSQELRKLPGAEHILLPPGIP